MKTIFTTIALLTLSAQGSTSAPAVTKNWKEDAIQEIATLQNVVEARWSERGSLWLSTLQSDGRLATYTQDVVCTELVLAGKPDGVGVLVSWYSAQALDQRQLVYVATALCI
ncbi:hypothetical protein [Ruegeria sp. ANG-R]|uniref:hypothetical protein n=1 Tax=Ruegeria sp. ANG-R TaxID=1577903 RepID=UPI000AED1273|nr:hypothetical protein [Ruegeria sp. ANG-R]